MEVKEQVNMDGVNTMSARLMPDQLTRRSVRAFWDDGLWDLASVGVAIITAIWGHAFVRLMAFPHRTWPWPFETEQSGARGTYEFWLLLGAYIAVIVLYVWCAWKVVLRLKAKWVEPHTGEVRHPFLLTLEPKTLGLYFVLYLGGIAALAGVYSLLLGGPHMYSAIFTMSPVAITYAIGHVYDLNRYKWIAIIAFLLCIGLELLLTTPAVPMRSPVNFLDVSPEYGSATLPMIVWAVMWTISGVVGMSTFRREYHGE